MKALFKFYWAATWGYPNFSKFTVLLWHLTALVILILILGIFVGLGFFVWTNLFSLFS